MNPYDPDCPEIVDPCASDGSCTMGCSPPDPDCPMTTTTVTTTGPMSVSAVTTTTTGTGAGGAGGAEPPRADPTARRGDLLYGRGCTCEAPGEPSRVSPWWLLACALVFWRRLSHEDE